MAFDSRVPPPPPIIPGTTDTGQAPPNPLETISQMFNAQPDRDEQIIQEVIMKLRTVQSPAYSKAVGTALRALLSNDSQAGSFRNAGGGQSNIIGSASPGALSPSMQRYP